MDVDVTLAVHVEVHMEVETDVHSGQFKKNLQLFKKLYPRFDLNNLPVQISRSQQTMCQAVHDRVIARGTAMLCL